MTFAAELEDESIQHSPSTPSPILVGLDVTNVNEHLISSRAKRPMSRVKGQI